MRVPELLSTFSNATTNIGRSIRDRKRGRKDPADIINGSNSENFLSNLSPFDAINFSSNGKYCGTKVGKQLRIFVLFAIRNSSVRSATIGSANSLLKQERKKVLKLPSVSCKTASPKSRKNCRIVSSSTPLEAVDSVGAVAQRWNSLLMTGNARATISSLSPLASLHISHTLLTDWRRLGSEAGSAAAAESRDAAESERRWKS